MAGIFENIYCSVLANGSRMLSWTMTPNANYPETFSLQVEYSRNGGDWEVLASGLTDVCAYIDSRPTNYNKYLNDCYRIKLIAGTGTTQEVLGSDICQAGRNYIYPYSNIAKNAITQIEKEIDTTGRTGVLLKRKEWGQRCTHCTDFDKQDGASSRCPYCLGTGIDGGYYNGITLPIVVDQQTEAQQQGLTGITELGVLQARCVAFPWIALGDVWVEDGTNYRYSIEQATPSAMFKHIPLVYTLKLHRLELTNIMYGTAATAKVTLKDIWDDVSVTYTPVAPTSAPTTAPAPAPATTATQELPADAPNWARALRGGTANV